MNDYDIRCTGYQHSAGDPLEASMEDVEDLERVLLSDEDVKPFLFRLRMAQSKCLGRRIWFAFPQSNGLILVVRLLEYPQAES